MSLSNSDKLLNLSHGAVATLKEQLHVDISADEFINMIHKADTMDEFLREVDYPDSYNEPVDGLDTYVRDIVYDTFAISELGVRAWPWNGMDDEEREEFKTKLFAWIENRVAKDKNT